MITIKHHHDKHGHWVTTEHSDFRTYRTSTYAIGWDKPNYPMPATMLNADIACNYIYLDLCPHSKQSPCNACIEKFEDALYFDFDLS